MKKIPFFLLNICNFNLNLSKISNYPEFSNLLLKEYGLLDINDSESNFCFSIYEHYHSYITFNELLQEELSNDDIKIIIFLFLLRIILVIYYNIQKHIINQLHKMSLYQVNKFKNMKVLLQYQL